MKSSLGLRAALLSALIFAAIVAPMSACVGIADFCPVAAAAPTSLAYSGSIAGPELAVGWAASCHRPTMTAKISSDRIAARRPSELFISCA